MIMMDNESTQDERRVIADRPNEAQPATGSTSPSRQRNVSHIILYAVFLLIGIVL